MFIAWLFPLQQTLSAFSLLVGGGVTESRFPRCCSSGYLLHRQLKLVVSPREGGSVSDSNLHSAWFPALRHYCQGAGKMFESFIGVSGFPLLEGFRGTSGAWAALRRLTEPKTCLIVLFASQVILDLKGSDYNWSYQTPPSSPSTTMSRKSSMCR